MTAAHDLADRRRPKSTVVTNAGRELAGARSCGADPQTDLALLVGARRRPPAAHARGPSAAAGRPDRGRGRRHGSGTARVEHQRRVRPRRDGRRRHRRRRRRTARRPASPSRPTMSGGALVDPDGNARRHPHPRRNGGSPTASRSRSRPSRDVADQLDGERQGRPTAGSACVCDKDADREPAAGGASSRRSSPGSPAADRRAHGRRRGRHGPPARPVSGRRRPRRRGAGPATRRTRSTVQYVRDGRTRTAHGRRSKRRRPAAARRTPPADGLTIGPRLPAAVGTRDHERHDDRPRATTSSKTLDRELLNAVQWDFPLEPRPVRGAGRAPRHHRGRRCASGSPR